MKMKNRISGISGAREWSANLQQDRCCKAERMRSMPLAKAEKARMGDEAKSEDLPEDRVLLLRFQRRICSGFDVKRRNIGYGMYRRRI